MADADSMVGRAGRAAAGAMDEAAHLVDRVSPPAERHMVKQAYGLSVAGKLKLVWRLWRDPRVRTITRVSMVAGVVYMLLPVHILPRRFGPLRGLEKLVVLLALLWLIVRLTPRPVLREHLDEVE